MTQSEFENLEFGDKVYSITSGDMGVVVTKAGNPFIHFEATGLVDLTYISHEEVSLMAPKKKVKKEITICISMGDLLEILETNSCGQIFADMELMKEPSERYQNVTITYETEE